LETNIKDIYEEGDCALQYHLVKEQDDYSPLGTTANKQGRIAGMNMAGHPRKVPEITGSYITKFIELSLKKTEATENKAERLNIQYKSVKIKATDIAGYYPNAQPIHIKLVYQKDNRSLLGRQIIGEKGVDKRVDVLPTALFNKM